MKDLYDLYWLQSHLNFRGTVLTQAVINTFAGRATEIPQKTPIAFTKEFSSDGQKILQWNAFVRKGKLPPLELADVISNISRFLLPILKSASL